MIKKLLLFIVLLMLVSCNKPGTSYDYKSGIEGIEVSFSEGVYDSLYEKEEFIINLNIENKGAYSTSNAYFSVFTERDVIDNKEDYFTIKELEGRSLLRDYGDLEYKEIKTNIKEVFIAEKIDSKVRIDYCYPYETFLSTEVCVDSDPRNEFEQNIKGCSVGAKSLSRGQGGPVAVTKIEPVFTPSGEGVIPKIKIIVENLGDGIVVDKTNYGGACKAVSYDRKNYGIINVDEIYLGSDKLNCNKNKLVVEKISRGNEFYESDRAVMVCTGSLIKRQEMYNTALRVGIQYGYKDFVEQDITILKQNYND
ncbi:hypothetical protein KY321_00350 [Candidatus Woesearchaeota archaeon]|nr:hypothetical protein [Candidatus Woesearchaeota archaeon]